MIKILIKISAKVKKSSAATGCFFVGVITLYGAPVRADGIMRFVERPSLRTMTAQPQQGTVDLPEIRTGSEFLFSLNTLSHALFSIYDRAVSRQKAVRVCDELNLVSIPLEQVKKGLENSPKVLGDFWKNQFDRKIDAGISQLRSECEQVDRSPRWRFNRAEFIETARAAVDAAIELPHGLSLFQRH